MMSLMLSGQHWLARLGAFIYALVTGLGGAGVLILAIGDSSFLSVPEGNDMLIVILSAGGSWVNMIYYVGMTITGSVIGCMLLYYLGRKGGSPILRRRFSKASIERAERLFERYGILTVVIPSMLPPPMPFKIFVLSAGVFRLKAPGFLAAVVVGRTIRYATWGILAVLYGKSVMVYLEQNLEFIGKMLLVGFVVVIAATSFYYAFFLKKKRIGSKI